MRRQFDVCYKCGLPATSREHVPPICLFPERKDMKGLDLRSNLITVPSCDLHNSNKSKDDEFLMVSIAAIVGNNLLGFLHSITKVDRALRRKSADFLRKVVMRNMKSGEYFDDKGKKYSVLKGNPDFTRLSRCFNHIAAGLYFHEHSKVFRGKIHIIMGFLEYEDDNTNTLVKFLRRRFELEKLALELKGDNPEVFHYQFCAADEYGLFSLKLLFYQGTEVFIGFQPEGSKTPSILPMQLINGGISTIVTLDDEEFHFNKERNSEEQ